MEYSVTILNLRPRAIGPTLARLRETLPTVKSGGEFLGCFSADLGVLNRAMILRGYPSAEPLSADREIMARGGGDLTGLGDHVVNFTSRSFRPFPFMPPIAAGNFGPYYEVREYSIKPGGVDKVMNAWKGALPRREKYSPNVAAMFSLDGTNAPGFMHIWPYKSLDDRATIRAKTVAEGIWPPEGYADQIVAQVSEIFVAAPFSPLR